MKTYYHYSKEWYCGPDFVPGTHFGTLEAAEDRWRNLGLRGGCLAEVFLDIRKPIRAEDMGEWSQPIGFLSMFLPKSARKPALIRQLVEEAGVPWPKGYSKQRAAIAEADYELSHDLRDMGHAWLDVFDILSSYGYDGIEYENRAEDVGSMSRMIFFPDQVEVLGYADLPLHPSSRWWDDVSREGLPDAPPFLDY